MPSARSPTVLLLGAQGTGAPALAQALQGGLAATGITVLAQEHTAAGADDLPLAIQAASAAELVLLMGLDLPCPAAHRPAQEAADIRLRAALAASGTSYRVVYGSADGMRLAHALQALYATKTIATSADEQSAGSHFGLQKPRQVERPARLRAWNCEKCSDPECEHRLFTALMGATKGAIGPA